MSSGETQIGVNTNLQKQDLSNLDIGKLTPLSPEVISRQATINIGTIGHVAHGKSTVVKAISGVQTVRFKNELERNITIKLERLMPMPMPAEKQYAARVSDTNVQYLLEKKPINFAKKIKVETTDIVAAETTSNEIFRKPPFHYKLTENQKHSYGTRSSSLDSANRRDISTSPSSGYESLSENAYGILHKDYKLSARCCVQITSLDEEATKKLVEEYNKYMETNYRRRSLRTRTPSRIHREVLANTSTAAPKTPKTPRSRSCRTRSQTPGIIRGRMDQKTPKTSQIATANKCQTRARSQTPASSNSNSASKAKISARITKRRQTVCAELADFSAQVKAEATPRASRTPKRQRHSNSVKEYVVESIRQIECVNNMPFFRVIWQNYPESQATWESFQVVSECEQLEPFINEVYQFYEGTIEQIITDINDLIDREGIIYDTNKFNIKTIERFDPLIMNADLILLAQFRLARTKNRVQTDIIQNRVIDNMLIHPFFLERRKQLKDLEHWQKLINEKELAAPIKLENNVDLETLEPSFKYISESFAGSGVSLGDQQPVIGCKCNPGECVPAKRDCCARLAGSLFAYTKTGRLRLKKKQAIYECNSLCSCGDDCVNRVIQKGRKNSLCLFKTSNGRGWGVRTEKTILKGDFVCEYVGEIITVEEANERGKKYDAIGRTYLFDLDFNPGADCVYSVDAANYGNISHFLNHSCEPNLMVYPFWINNLDINLPRLAFFAVRNIKPGEELTFDYIDEDSRGDDNKYENLSDARKVTCRCGAATCRQVLF